MTETIFRKRVSAVTSMPDVVVRYITSLSGSLTPEARETIVAELEHGDREAVKIVEKGITKISAIVRKMRKKRLSEREQADRVSQSLPEL